ncbi:MAG: helix-turn-helix transcriptional regulator [Faecalimonas sp.]|nr:helix-turn-helix transcriptional regulator [Faecalimonas sp.]
MDFADTLKLLRESNDVTQAELAKHLKVSRPTIAGYETKHHQPDFDRLIKIAEFFNVSIDFLVTGENIQRADPLDREIQTACIQLSTESKQDVLKYIRLLQGQKK